MEPRTCGVFLYWGYETIDDIVLNFSKESFFLLNLSLGFIMFGVAINLKLEDFMNVFKTPKSALLGLFSQFILLPLLTFLLVLIFQPKASMALGMMLVAACPGGNISNFMCATAKANTALSVSLTAISSFLAVIMTPLNLTIWASLYGPTHEILQVVSLDFWELFRTIATILLIPLFAGMSLRHFKPTVARKLHPIMHYSSIMIFAAIVFMAFRANFDFFLSYIHVVVFIVLVHNAAALFGGYQLGKLFKLATADKRSLAIETGIQNSGLGLVLIFTFFDGLGGMAIVAAWWGIWHIFSGLGLAFFWSKKQVIASVP